MLVPHDRLPSSQRNSLSPPFLDPHKPPTTDSGSHLFGRYHTRGSQSLLRWRSSPWCSVTTGRIHFQLRVWPLETPYSTVKTPTLTYPRTEDTEALPCNNSLLTYSSWCGLVPNNVGQGLTEKVRELLTRKNFNSVSVICTQVQD